MSINKLKIEYLSIDKLIPYAHNPRFNSAAIEPVKKSIEYFGFIDPIIVRRSDNMIISGHTRIKSAMKIGLKEVPVIFVDMSENDAKLYNLADNKLGELAQWDISGLSSICADLKELDVDISLAGFDLSPNDLNKEWEGMPEFESKEIEGNAIICIVRFLNENDIKDFEKKLGYKLQHKGKIYSTYFPPQDFNQTGKGLEFSDES